MPFYQNINANTEQGKRTIENLIKLRKKLDKEIPKKQLESNLILATWNIREFDAPTYGYRLEEALCYIAEIIARFDIIALQEIRDDLTALRKVVEKLGGYWDFLFTDVTEGSQGNGERMVFLYDTRKVRFAGLASELVLPPFKTTDPVTNQTIYQPVRQLARTPYMCGFKAGWTNFVLSTVHILYGEAKANSKAREQEIRCVADTLARRSKEEHGWSKNLILLGDFNIFDPKDITFKAIIDAGFMIPKELQNLPGNALKNKFYDQIAFINRPDRFQTTGKAGVFDYYECVFKNEDEKIYAQDMGKAYTTTANGEPRKDKSVYYKTYWRTFQMSDHLPMWVEIDIDNADEYLANKLAEAKVD